MAEVPFGIVTGGSRGIGRAIVLRLAQEGFDVGFTFAARQDAARETEEAVVALGRRAWSTRWDQAEAEGAAGAFDSLLGSAGRSEADVVVASAGIIAHAAVADMAVADYDRVMAVNARGTFAALGQAARLVRDGGRVVAISSMATRYPTAGEAAYAGSKAAVEQFCRVLSRELGRRGVTVNCVAPGPTETDLFGPFVPAEVKAQVAALTALGRVAQPQDVAGAVWALCAPAAGWLTGQVATADGGLT